jgi:hypothetical protein
MDISFMLIVTWYQSSSSGNSSLPIRLSLMRKADLGRKRFGAMKKMFKAALSQDVLLKIIGGLKTQLRPF